MTAYNRQQFDPKNVTTTTIIAAASDMRVKKFCRPILGIKWDLVIVDEIHMAKSLAPSCSNIRMLHHRLIGLSGTPLQNNLEELISMMKLVEHNTFASLIVQILSNESEHITGVWMEQIQRRFLRRTKQDAGIGVPPKQVARVWCPLSHLQQVIDSDIRKSDHHMRLLYRRPETPSLQHARFGHARKLAVHLC